MTSRSPHARLAARLTSAAALALLVSLPAAPAMATDGGPDEPTEVAPRCANDPADGDTATPEDDCAASNGPSARPSHAAAGDPDGTDERDGETGRSDDAPSGDDDVPSGDGDAASEQTDETPPAPRTIEDPLEEHEEVVDEDHTVDVDEDALNATVIDPTSEDPDVLGVQESRSLGSAHTTDPAGPAGSTGPTSGGQLPATGVGTLAALTGALASFALGGTLLRRTSRRHT